MADADFSALLPYIRRITEEVLEHGLPAGICLNVNFPDVAEFKGVRICRQTNGTWEKEWKVCTHPRGGEYYWLTGQFVNHEPEAVDSDHWALNHGYVAITPTQIDVTAYSIIKGLEKLEIRRMKYYLIVGEASGDLHASNLMRALQQEDSQADFRFFGGDKMSAVGGSRVKHYKELAYMGFIPVLLHLRTILRNMRQCQEDIVAWQPDVVILVDYPGFNLKIAEYIKKNTQIPVYYYISPKIWAWKEYRIKNIKRDVDELFSILPFEIDFFAGYRYPIHYVGNPCVDAVDEYCKGNVETFGAFAAENVE